MKIWRSHIRKNNWSFKISTLDLIPFAFLMLLQNIGNFIKDAISSDHFWGIN